MAKWTYSTLTADERLDRIRKGDEDVYNSEIERSNDVIKQRKEAGLDISAQNNWIDTLNYNYGLSKAENKAKRNKPITIKSNEVYAAQKVNELFEDYCAKVKQAEDEENHLKEWLLNNGIDEKSKVGKEYLDGYRAEAKNKINKYYNEYTNSVDKLLKELELR